MWARQRPLQGQMKPVEGVINEDIVSNRGNIRIVPIALDIA